MAWTYSDWITLTGASRLTRLRQHIQEVSDAMTATTISNGETYNPAHLQSYLDRLTGKEAALAAERAGGGAFFVPTRRSD